MHDVSGGDIRTGTRPFVSSTIHLCALFQYVSMAVSGMHTKLNQSSCLPQFLMSFPFVSYKPIQPIKTSHRIPGNIRVLDSYKRCLNGGELQHNYRHTFLRRSSETCFLLPELQTFIPPPPPPPAPAELKSNNHLQLLAEDTVGAPPPGSSSAQVNLFMVAPLNPGRPR